jgi:N-acyl-D-aspartate/D-glutamate deacylase
MYRLKRQRVQEGTRMTYDLLIRGDKEMLYDLPGDEGRFVQRAEGIHWVIVNGAVLFADGAHSGALPGRVLQARKTT